MRIFNIVALAFVGAFGTGCHTGYVAQESVSTGSELHVKQMELRTGEVQKINVWHGYHTILEFPYPISMIDAGRSDVFSAEIVGNKLALKAGDVDAGETSMSVILDDGDETVFSFLIRSDSTGPMASIVRLTVPVKKTR